MKKFIKNHKKQCIIGGIIFLVIFFAIIIWLFIIPIFSNNKYGDRLDGIEDHEISSETIDTIEEALLDNEQILDFSYNNEGRCLRFIITVDSEMSTDDAKALGDVILENIDEDDQSYYDIEFYVDTEEDNDNYPIAGYKHKTSDTFVFGNESESSE